MRKLTLLAALAAATAISSPAMAGSADGKWQVKVLGTGVLPDGKITKVYTDPGLPTGTQTKANDNVVPTVAIEYFVLPNMSIETICCLTQHDVDASAGDLAGAELVSNAKLIPATFTAKFHLPTGTGIKPYAGVGATYFLWVDQNPGSATVGAPFNIDKLKLSDEFGLVLQGGLDVALGESGFGITADVKKYFVDTKARWSSGGTEVLATKHKLDPWVLSAGVAFAF